MLTPPVPGSRYTKWAITLHPFQSLLPSKVREWDEAALLDQDEFLFLIPGFKTLRRTLAPRACLFRFSQQVFSKKFTAAARAAGITHLKAHSYQLRHSGPSFDRALGRRSALEVKFRGRWKSDASLRRYEKEGRVSQQLANLPPEVRRRALAAPAVIAQRLATL